MPLNKHANMPRKIAPEVYMVGGPDLSDPRDCLCYLVLGSQARVLIDCGAGPSAKVIMELVSGLTREPLTHLLLTHAHIDHVGGAAQIAGMTGCQVLIHEDDASVLASGDTLRSAANWYGLGLEAVRADRLLADGEVLEAGSGLSLNIVHTPGHTPGSLCAWCVSGGQRVLFGQDVHGPFSPAFGSDIGQWRQSMQRLLEIKADILAEGHYGVFRPAAEVESFIRQQLAQQS